MRNPRRATCSFAQRGRSGKHARDFPPDCRFAGRVLPAGTSGKLAEASAQTYLAPDRAVPPILLLHGDRDTQVSAAHSRTLYERLTQNGAEADYIELAGVNHGGAPFWTEDVLQIIADFIHKHY